MEETRKYFDYKLAYDGYKKVKELADNTIILEDGENEWFVKEEILDNENIIGAYRVFNGEIENYNEFYTIILEKVEVFDNAE